MDKKGYILEILRQLEDEPPNQNEKKTLPKKFQKGIG